LIGAKNEIIKFGRSQLEELAIKIRGIKMPERTANVQAACTVLATTAFCEAASNLLSEAGWTGDQVAAQDLAPPETRRRHSRELDREDHAKDFVRNMVLGEVPSPDPQETQEYNIQRLKNHYRRLASRLARFVQTLSAWDELTESRQTTMQQAIEHDLPNRAAELYESMFRRLAGEVPELFVWATLRESAANRHHIVESVASLIQSSSTEDLLFASQLDRGLSGLHKLLSTISQSIPRPESRWQRSLISQYRHELKRPYIDIGMENAMGVVAPTPQDGYINPSFKSVKADAVGLITSEDWWGSLPCRNDLQEFLVTYLTTPASFTYPLIVLGHPGAGKSMLMRVIAAQLPARAYSPVLVQLRDVAASASVLGQIEAALHSTIHEPVQWPAFVESVPHVLPVVLLDGFDELLQATGLSRSDYLEQVRDFQEREYVQGRPVAVIVTSRTVVADRARIPSGCTIVKLEPFDDDQVVQWVQNWNDVNDQNFRTRDIGPLEPSAVLEYKDLAPQPILLLMLALYDSAGNRLSTRGDLNRIQLYEQLLRVFIEREIEKGGRRDRDQLSEQVENELYNLSVVAFGMFNRGRQVVYDSELNRDFEALQITSDRVPVGDGLYARLTDAQRTLGRFFFIHRYEASVEVLSSASNRESRNMRADSALGKSYEFLHATFGEFLVARCLATMIRSLASQPLQKTPWRNSDFPTHDSLLNTLLSWQALTKRRQVVIFLQEIFASLDSSEAASASVVAKSLLVHSLFATTDTEYREYRISRDEPTRYAILSFNLLIAYLTASRTPALLDVDPDEVKWWRRQTLLWRSRLDEDAWVEASKTLTLSFDAKRNCLCASLGQDRATDQGYANIFDDVMDIVKGASVVGTDLMPDLFDNSWRSSMLSLEETAASGAQLQVSLRGTLGDLSDTVICGVPRSIPTMLVNGLPPSDRLPAVSPLLLIATGALDDEPLANAFSAAVRVFELSAQFVQDKDCKAVALLLHLAAVHHDRLPLDLLESVVASAGLFSPSTTDFHFFSGLTLAACCLYSRTWGDNRKTALDSLRSAFASLDPLRVLDSRPAELLELVLKIEDIGVPMQFIASGFGSYLEWIDRLDVADISYGRPALAIRAIRLAVQRRLSYWLVYRGPQVLRSLSPAARRLLSNDELKLISAQHDDKMGTLKGKSAQCE